MGHRFHIIDVFTSTAFEGNQLAVVEEADDFSDQDMLAIAKEFGFSETVFLQSSSNGLASARVRIFTPSEELPFAGHPIVGTAVFLGQTQPKINDNDAKVLLMLEAQIGLIRTAVSLEENSASYAEFDLPKLPEVLTDVPEVDQVADALGLGVADIGFENHKIMSARAGIKFIYVPVRNSHIVREAYPAMAYWGGAFGRFGPLGVYVYGRDDAGSKRGFHVRMFAPDMGILEDAATGSAAAGFASVIERYEIGNQSFYETTLSQGHEMGRPSQIKLEVELEDQGLRKVRIGGRAVLIASGDLL